MMDKKNEIRWEFVRRNPHYIKDFNDWCLLKSEDDDSWEAFRDELLNKWGIKELISPNEKAVDNINLSNLIVSTVISKNQALQHGTTWDDDFIFPTEDRSFFYELGEKLLGNAQDDEKRFSVISFDLKMFSTVKSLEEVLYPVLKNQIDKYNNEKNLPQKIEKYLQHLELFDRYQKEFQEIFKKPIDNISNESLNEYLSTTVAGDKLFKTYLKAHWNETSLEKISNSLETTFSLVRRAPYIAL